MKNAKVQTLGTHIIINVHTHISGGEKWPTRIVAIQWWKDSLVLQWSNFREIHTPSLCIRQVANHRSDIK